MYFIAGILFVAVVALAILAFRLNRLLGKQKKEIEEVSEELQKQCVNLQIKIREAISCFLKFFRLSISSENPDGLVRYGEISEKWRNIYDNYLFKPLQISKILEIIEDEINNNTAVNKEWPIEIVKRISQNVQKLPDLPEQVPVDSIILYNGQMRLIESALDGILEEVGLNLDKFSRENPIS